MSRKSCIERVEIICLLAILAILFPVLTSCSGAVSQPPPEKVEVQLKWFHQAQFAGFYVAQQEGYYQEANLDVNLIQGGPEVDVLARLASGEVEFAVYSPEDLLVERSTGEPLVAIGVIYRRNPMAFVSLQGKGITRPSDLEGKSVAVAPDGLVQFNALVRKMALDPERIHMADYDYSYASFVKGAVDVTEAYATGGMIRLRNQGYDLDIIWPDDYGIHFYADTLITTEEIAENNPEVVTRFLRSTLRGWQEAMGNTDQAVEATMKYADDSEPKIQVQMLKASVPLVHTGDDYPGWMEHEIWRGMYERLWEEGMLEDSFALKNAYSMQFLKDVYGEAE